MMVLDTNVISALMRSEADRRVAAWMNAQVRSALWTTSITLFELETGIWAAPEGRRRRELQDSLRRVMSAGLGNRVLDFDSAAAREAGMLAARRARLGRPAEYRDTQIAGIVLANRAALATRNLRHFQDLPVEVVDPWAAALG